MFDSIHKHAAASRAALESSARPITPDVNSPLLPEAVRRYLRWSGVTGKENYRLARLIQSGSIQGKDQAWIPMECQQVIRASPPGFAWTAKAPAAPMVTMNALDEFTDQGGLFWVRLYDLLTISKLSGEQYDEGELIRYAAEMTWLPFTLADPSLMMWKVVSEDGNVVEGTLSATTTTTNQNKTNVISVTGTFHFDEEGRVVMVEYPSRVRETTKSGVQRSRWRARNLKFEKMGAYVLPVESEAAWVSEDGKTETPYVRMTLRSAEFQ